MDDDIPRRLYATKNGCTFTDGDGYAGSQPFHAYFTAEGTLAEVEIYPPNEVKAARELKRQHLSLTSDALVKEAMLLADCDLL
jgi:hypothetical protein